MYRSQVIPAPKASIETADILLADVAIKIQLPPSLFEVATERYETIRAWIERPDSPLAGLVLRFYPQGSMAIDATIASRAKNDEFDIDIIAELDLDPESDPKEVLDLLYRAIRGIPGSRYYSMTKRQTRCVTVEYADMHLDVTPVVRQASAPERQSLVFHHKPETAHVVGTRHVANPWGLAEWFKQQTPADEIIAKMFYDRMALDGQVRADAEFDVVPGQVPAHSKSKALIALQLIKRFRNLRYDQRGCRQPPSVALVRLIGERADSGTSRLLHEVVYQAKYMLAVLEQNQRLGRLVHLTNPRCPLDVLTDRWPEDRTAQSIFIDDLRYLVARLEQLDDADLEAAREILVDLFGEVAGTEVVRKFAEASSRSIREGKSGHLSGVGRFATPAIGVVSAYSPRVEATKPHRFFGGELSPWRR
ncbi:nucleotidyltransferase [Reyranella sp.]|uniref:nucleotidyltransferase domain-containing protein n=1 Tax=Reyranella sp. TaxID=1929291 RepID=UPI00272FFA56|nr:nucleotidyltransferase [Reyranella sp.]MDP2372630.1 nucleotidyltransferase [Reyranella sp.]